MHGGRRNTGHAPSTRSHAPFRVSNYFLFLCLYKWNLVQNTCLVTSAIHLIQNFPKEHPWPSHRQRVPRRQAEHGVCPMDGPAVLLSFLCQCDTSLSFRKPRGGCCSVPLLSRTEPESFVLSHFSNALLPEPPRTTPGVVLSPSQQRHARQKTRSKPGVMVP